MNIEGKNILIFSGSSKLSNFVSNFILQKKALPFEANNSHTALNLLMNENIDLVVAELAYEDEQQYNNEFNLLKIINAQFIYMPIIVILKEFDQNVVRKLLKAGVVAFFVQPFDVEDLSLEIEKIRYWRSSIANRIKIAKHTALKYHLIINSDENIIGAVSYNIGEILKTIHPERVDDVNGVTLAVNEMIMNSIIHGNKGDITKTIDIDFLIDYEKIVIIITDEGQGFDYNNLPDPTDSQYILKESGRGIFLTRMYMDNVNFFLKGRRVELIKYFQKND